MSGCSLPSWKYAPLHSSDSRKTQSTISAAPRTKEENLVFLNVCKIDIRRDLGGEGGGAGWESTHMDSDRPRFGSFTQIQGERDRTNVYDIYTMTHV